MLKKDKIKRIIILILLVVSAICLVVFEFAKFMINSDPLIDKFIKDIISRMIAGIALVFVLSYLGYNLLNPLKKPFLKSLLFCIPAFIVALVNFPFFALLSGKAIIIHKDFLSIFLFIVECFSIGLIEEMFFRGILLPLFLEKMKNKKYGIILSVVISSLIFSLSHLLNLLLGMGSAVFMQLGYTFLIGLMLSIVVIKTKNIWLAVLIHSLFDIGGRIIQVLGSGSIWNVWFIVTTIISSVICAVTMGYSIFKIQKSSLVHEGDQ